MNHNDFKEYKPTLKASTFAIRTSQRTDQKLQKSLLCQRTPNDIINSPSHASKEGRSANSVYVAIAGEVVNRRSVLLSNIVLNGKISASNPLLHIHAKRYQQLQKKPLRTKLSVYRELNL